MLNNIAKEINCVLLKNAKLKWFKTKNIRKISAKRYEIFVYSWESHTVTATTSDVTEMCPERRVDRSFICSTTTYREIKHQCKTKRTR